MIRLLLLLTLPLAALGKLVGRLLPLDNPGGLFFIIPFYHTGGAEKVHADIAACCAPERPWIFFAHRSRDTAFLARFRAAARCFDIPLLLKYTFPFSVGVMAGLISRHPAPRLFGCNSLFFYLLLPHLAPHVRVIDLLHGLGGGAERFALPVLERIDQRVVISPGVREELLAFYRAHGVSPALDDRITVISNRVSVAPALPDKATEGPLTALFVGRGSEEKRVHLIARAARRCRELGVAVEVTLVGDVADRLTREERAACRLTGPIGDEAALTRLYRQSHLVLISSSREGFPLTLMEGMAQGCVPVATAVGGIPDHIRHLDNGWLLPAEDEESVVAGLVAALRQLAEERQLTARLAAAAFASAHAQFGGERFCADYRRLLQLP
ncbi:glycosyltransferase family 4 protein [Trichlorobacter ammonificans]|uniref:Glycosyl transferase family 1 domain-containing protein n=1 Tax=Trichlorobacter ammonificans TaxID=2916410 RepID=A0ABM9DC91_9BACT|nr:glycosyltransferase family 4 protein [Trichlorobacter ammonificans]CAH2032042.1 protein of unknown function [Trichlorobacter ammonificans]